MRKSQSGFTMLEMVIVIILIGIISVYAIFSWPGLAINVSGQAEQLADDLRYTQALSMTQGQRYRLVISGSSYQILNAAGTPVTLAQGNTTVTLNSGVSFGTLVALPNSLVAFDGKGIPYTDTGSTQLASNASIPLTGGGQTKTVVITPVTGRVITQ